MLEEAKKMQEQPGSQPASTNNIAKTLANNKNLLIAGVLLLAVLLAGFGLYKAGYNKGQSAGIDQGKKQAQKENKAADPLGIMQNQNYWSIVGTVEAVDGKSVTVKNNKGKVETATFEESITVRKKGQKDQAGTKDIAKGQEVIVTGERKDDKPVAKAVTIK